MGLKALLPWKLKQIIQQEISAGGRFQDLSYPPGPLSDFKLVQFHRNVRGRDCFGLGCSKDPKSAHLKAFYEFLERKAFFEHGIPCGFQTTNGIATHKFMALAKQAALAELLERDAFLLHWYGRLGFEPLPRKKYEQLWRQISYLRELGFETVIAKTRLGLRPTFVTFLVKTSTSGFAVGTSSGKTTSEDIEKSFIEACTNLFIAGPHDDNASMERIKSNRIQSLMDHRAIWLHLAGIPKWAFECNDSKQVKARPFSPSLIYHKLAIEPLPTAGVTAAGILQIRVGPPTTEDHMILLGRLQFFGGSEPSLADLPFHPIP